MFGIKPQDTGHELNVNETFRKCPGCLMNLYVRSVYPLCPGRVTVSNDLIGFSVQKYPFFCSDQ